MDIDESIKCLVELVSFAGRAKDVAALKVIREKLADIQEPVPNSPVKELPHLVDCMHSLGYWRETARDTLDAIGAQNMYAHIKRKISE